MRSKSGSRAEVGAGRDTLGAAASDSGALMVLRGYSEGVCSEGVTSEATRRYSGGLRRHLVGVEC